MSVDKDHIERLIRGGKLYVKEIAEAAGCTQGNITYHARRLGIHAKSRLKRQGSVDRDRIVELISKGGLSTQGIADTAGCSYPTVTRLAREHGLSVQGGPRTPRKVSNELGRFWSKVTKLKSGCWEFTGNRPTHSGYVQFTLAPEHYKAKERRVYAHRYLWEKENGPVPPYSDLHHTCENKICIRLSHLKVMTKDEHGEEHRRLNTLRKVTEK